MPLENEDGFFHGNFPVSRWPVAHAVEFRDVGFILLEHIVDSCKEHPGNGDDGFLVTPALFESEIAISDFRELFGSNGA